MEKHEAEQIKKVESKAQMDDLNEELDKVKFQIDDLLKNIQPEDSEAKSNIKKIKDIKKFLDKKTHAGASSNTGLMFRLRRNKKREIKKAIDEILNDEENALSITASEIFESIYDRSQENISSLQIDDSVIHGIDCVISIWESFKDYIENKNH